MGKTDPRQLEYARSYDQRQRDRGLVRVSVWVPKDRKADLMKVAADMVEDYNEGQLPAA